MKVFFWNVRGLGRTIARDRIREFYSKLEFEILIVVEPLIKPRKNVVKEMGLIEFSSSILHNGEEGRKANIWVIHRNEIKVDVVSVSRQQITFLADNVLISVVHAKSVYGLRRELWQQLEAVKGSMPWVVFGDFNCVLHYDEKHGGRIPSSIAIEEFQKAIDDCELVEAQYSGLRFTWCNNRQGR